MKGLINILLNEAVGVPVGLAETAREIFNDLLIRINKTPNSEFYNGVTEIEYTLSNPNEKYNFADFQIDNVETSLVFEQYPKIPTLTILGLQVGHSGRITPTGNLRSIGTQMVNINIRFGYPSSNYFTLSKEVVIDLMENNKLQLISSLGHELKHSYDNFKNPTRTLKSASEYDVHSGFRVPQKFINDFLFDMYYMARIEGLVRPSEVYTLMNEKKISKKEFLNFFLKTTTFKRLKEISNNSFEKFIQTIKDEMPDIERVLMSFENIKDSVKDMTEDEKINHFLSAVYITLFNKTMDAAASTLKLDNPFSQIFMPSEERLNRIKAIEKMEKELFKYKNNPRKYFELAFKKNQINAQKIIQRISKVYSLLDN